MRNLILSSFVFLIGLIIFLITDFKKAVNQRDNAIKQRDSLQNELFIEQTNVQRYETAAEMMESEDSVLYQKFQDYLSETE